MVVCVGAQVVAIAIRHFDAGDFPVVRQQIQIAVHCAAAHARALRVYGKVDILGGGMIAAAAHSVQHQAALIGVAAAFHGSPLLSLPFRTLCVGRGDMERITETTEEISGICNMTWRFAEGKIWHKKATKLLKYYYCNQ